MCYLVWDSYFNEKEVPKDEGAVTPVVEEKDDAVVDAEGLPEEIEKEEIIQYDGGDPNEKESLTGAITYLGVSGNDLVVRVNIDQYLSGGDCEMNIVRGSEVLYTSTVPIIDSASTSTCEGFNVPVEKLSSGKIQVNINLSSGERIGIISGETEI